MKLKGGLLGALLGVAVISMSAVASAAAEGGHEDGVPGDVKSAVATIAPRSGSEVQGTATFARKGGKVQLTLVLQNLTPGVHAVHLHETGDCSDPEGKSAGAHWNPSAMPHGKWGAPAHLGDIGNVVADKNGKATFKMTTELWTIGGSAETNVLGKAVIVHKSEDDFKTQPTGNAGGRIGCGVVQPKK